MKRKIMILVLAAIFCCSAIACGGSETETVDHDTISEESNSDESVDDEGEEGLDGGSKSLDVTIDSQELFNQEGVVITATEIVEDALFGTEIKLLIENNSEKNITVQTRNSSVNGYMIDFHISSEIAAGKKANDSIAIFSDNLETCDITAITDLEFSFHIFDTETWDTIIDSDMITISTSASGIYEQQYDSSGEVLYDSNGVKIISKGFSEDSLMGSCILLYMENNTDQSITIQSKDTSVNGFMVDTVLSSDIMPGKIALDQMVFLSADLESNGIVSFDEVETAFHIFDTNSWEDITDTDSVIIPSK